MDMVIKIELTRSKLVMILKFSEKFVHQFSHVFIFGNMFPERHGFDAVHRVEEFRLTSLIL